MILTNSKPANPFYGMQKTLEAFQKGKKGFQVNWKACFDEVKTQEQLELVVSLLFSIGDVPRAHHIFGGKIENGGDAHRELFRDSVLPALYREVVARGWDQQYFFELVYQYTTLDNLLAMRVKTRKKSAKVEQVINMPSTLNQQELVKFLVSKFNGSVIDKMTLAKFLTRMPGKRKGHTKVLPETAAIRKAKKELLTAFSEAANLAYGPDFHGYYNWRKKYNQDFESVLFATGRVKELDQEQFTAFLTKLPSDARGRVKARLFNEKWAKQKVWFGAWENRKEEAQKEERILTDKINQGVATEEDHAKLVVVKKEAKATFGAFNFQETFKKMLEGKADEIAIHSFLQTLMIPNAFLWVDDSGSMSSGTSWGFSARQFAAFILTVFLTQMKDVDAASAFGTFSNTARVFGDVKQTRKDVNKFLPGEVKQTSGSLVKPEDTFTNNWHRISEFLNAISEPNNTDVSTITRFVSKWLDSDTTAKDKLAKFPLWILISDGNFNNLGSAAASLNDFFRKFENIVGFRPYVICIDVATNTSQTITQFIGIDNMIMLPPSLTNIETLLKNYKDIDVYDVYTPLLTLHRSERYAPVRKLVK